MGRRRESAGERERPREWGEGKEERRRGRGKRREGTRGKRGERERGEVAGRGRRSGRGGGRSLERERESKRELYPENSQLAEMLKSVQASSSLACTVAPPRRSGRHSN